MRVHYEYEYIKKRGLMNFLTSERLNVEKHFYDRALGMLKQIKLFEENNMGAQLRKVATESIDALKAKIEGP